MYGYLRRLTEWFRTYPRSRRRPKLLLERLEERSLPSGSPLPALNSDTGAAASLYLDFSGLPTQTWGGYTNVTTPAFDLDGNPSSFSPAEVAVVTEVWQRVAEIYSPFNINVTTVAPADLSHGKTQIVAIGGSYNDWFHQAAGGVSYVGAFANAALPNISHVFVDGTAGVAKYIAVAAAHEAGHAFGLDHQSTFSASGTLVQEYNPGDSASAPIMGLAYSSNRALWWVGPNDTGATQNDEAVIADAANGFGYRPDAYGRNEATATALSVLNGQAGAAGVIDTPTSTDYFTFTTSGGAANFTVNTVQVGPTLHARLELWSASGLVAVGDSSTSLGASISTTLTAGRYYLVVGSHGGHGDVGQYTLSVQAPAGNATQPNNPPPTNPNPTNPNPTTQNPSNPPPTNPPPTNQPFIVRLYLDLLHRNPGESEVASWQANLNAGVTPSQIVHAFMNSNEYLSGIVQDDYAQYLGRNADPGGVAGWVAAMQAGMSQEHLAATLMESQEFSQNHGGDFNGWISGVFERVLNRPVDAGGLAGFAAARANGASLDQIALGVVNSAEADSVFVNSEFLYFLQRPADAGALNAFVPLMQQGTTRADIIAILASSPEYVQK
jgi:Domain of unknown function (DUF4214)/Metallo-peptidase family M12B Reprolysin-like